MVANYRALIWKHPGKKIGVRDGVIVDWDDTLGPLPNQSTMDTWEAEYQAHLVSEDARKRIPREPNDNKPVTWGDLNRVLDALDVPE